MCQCQPHSVDHSGWKMSMPQSVNTGAGDTKAEPVAARLAILPPTYRCQGWARNGFYRPDYSKEMSADSLYNPYKWYSPQTPLKMFKKKSPPPHSTIRPSSLINWLDLNKISEISILQSAHKQSNPSFNFHAPGSKHRYPCTQTASAVQKYFPCLLQFCISYRIWHASRVWKRWFSHS